MPKGRRSQASLSIVPPAIPGAGRPDPPSHLDAIESPTWSAIVGALPGHWIDFAGEQVRLRLVAQAAFAAALETRLRALRAQRSPDDEKIARLAGIHSGVANRSRFS